MSAVAISDQIVGSTQSAPLLEPCQDGIDACNRFIMRDRWPRVCQCLTDLGPYPSVMCLGLFGRGKFADNRIELGHPRIMRPKCLNDNYSAATVAAAGSARAASSSAAFFSTWATISSIMPLLACLPAILPFR